MKLVSVVVTVASMTSKPKIKNEMSNHTAMIILLNLWTDFLEI